MIYRFKNMQIMKFTLTTVKYKLKEEIQLEKYLYFKKFYKQASILMKHHKIHSIIIQIWIEVYIQNITNC